MCVLGPTRIVKILFTLLIGPYGIKSNIIFSEGKGTVKHSDFLLSNKILFRLKRVTQLRSLSSLCDGTRCCSVVYLSIHGVMHVVSTPHSSLCFEAIFLSLFSI